MKKILITGQKSYIGNSLERYLFDYNAAQGRELYRTDKISQRRETWEEEDFSGYDAVFDVTGIAHADTGKVSEKQKSEYYRVNCDLAVHTAEKAKAQGVPLFLYMSSIIVYGDSAPMGEEKIITEKTQPAPVNFYGDSKWQAERHLLRLQDENFKVAILRPPFIYGRNCKGNYRQLAALAEKLSVFPDIQNRRSMLYVENLCEFVRLLVERGEGGVFFPQNAQYSVTSRMVLEIAQARGKDLRLTKALNPLVRLCAKLPGKPGRLANKAFGSLSYDQSMSGNLEEYCLYSLEDSIRRTER